MEEYKKLDVELFVRVSVELDDPEASEQTVRFLVEEDLRDKGWNADVWLNEDHIRIMEE